MEKEVPTVNKSLNLINSFNNTADDIKLHTCTTLLLACLFYIFFTQQPLYEDDDDNDNDREHGIWMWKRFDRQVSLWSVTIYYILNMLTL